VVRGSWFVVRGSWFVVRGSWFVVRGSLEYNEFCVLRATVVQKRLVPPELHEE
jgi:hypothetical protein